MSRKTKWGIGVGIAPGRGVRASASPRAKRGNKATEVRIEEVEKRDLVASVTASGQVQPQTKVDLTADISGRIVRLAVKEGQMVTRGQFLLEIDPVQYQAGVQRAEAARRRRARAGRAGASQSGAGAAQLRPLRGDSEGESDARVRRAGRAAQDAGRGERRRCSRRRGTTSSRRRHRCATRGRA